MVHPSSEDATSLPLPQPPAPSSIEGGDDDDDRATAVARRRPPWRCYAYVPYDVLDADWLGDTRRLILPGPASSSSSTMRHAGEGDDGSGRDGHNYHHARYSPGTLVWVLLSKGRRGHHRNNNTTGGCGDALALHKKRRDKKNRRRIVDDEGSRIDDEIDNEVDGDEEDDDERKVAAMNYSRKEFFLRARVVSDDESIDTSSSSTSSSSSSFSNGGYDPTRYGRDNDRDRRRVLVRYSRGSTYRVRACNLVPVLESRFHDDVDMALSPTSSTTSRIPPLVVLVPETNIYRRVARVHTTPRDTFLEIGCDYGITVDRVRSSLVTAGDVPLEWPKSTVTVDGKEVSNDDIYHDVNDHIEMEEVRVSCLGVDKSKESIDIANQRYPDCEFALGDVLVPGVMSQVRELCERRLVNKSPSVICIDINGNRDIDGVLECLKMVMNEHWSKMPRMIVVKSRFLYWEMKKGGVK
ncbi:hypothetical protein ACHAXA_000201 [Cyclostephanos tholiformis]|uniref:Uncharacterized protein n=1 Tax=Cyclostephanos tholiformis TaxID=382380 RepID=A0ABD3RVM2_9STRA